MVYGLAMTTSASSQPSAATDALRVAPKTPLVNETITTQLAHRSIRAFAEQPLSQEELETLYTVARHGASCTFAQQYTIIHVTDPAIRHEIFLASGQPYVDGTKGDLFVFVVDLYRNQQIRAEGGIDEGPGGRTNLFVAGLYDAMIAAQNMVIAAESLGLGTVYLASIQADPRRVIKALALPKMTYPAVGMLIGHPLQEPQFKPRLPQDVVVVENTYPTLTYGEALADYDATLQEYYDMRDLNNRVDSFTQQIRTKYGMGAAEQSPMLEILHEQGLLHL